MLQRILLMSALAMVLPLSLGAQELAPEWFGTWQLNIQASTFDTAAPPYVRGRWIVKRAADEHIEMTYDQVGVRGGVTHMEWRGRFDGADYRLQGPDAVVTYAYSIVDARTLGLVVKVDGQQAATARVVLSPDGTAVTATTTTRAANGAPTTVTAYTRRPSS